MRDEKRLLITAIIGLVVLTLLFAGGVVIITRSNLSLAGGDPLSQNKAVPDEECGRLMAVAAEASVGGHPQEALLALGLIEDLSCGDAFRTRAAQIYRTLGRSGDAVRLLTSLAEKYPLSRELHCELGWSLLESGYSDSAKRVFHLATRMRGSQSRTVRSLAWLALAVEESLTASQLFSQALELQPDDNELWRALSQIELRLGNKHTAERAALEAVRLDPASCGSYLALGWTAEALDRPSAENAFMTAMALCPSDSFISFETGRFYFRSGRADRAVPILRAAVGASSCPLEWLLLLARAEKANKNFGEARQTLRLARSRFPADYRPIFELAKLHRRTGQLKRARQHAEAALELAPQEPTILKFLSTLRHVE